MTYVLILFAHVGMMGSGNSNSIATEVFKSHQTCLVALKEAEALSQGSTKIIKGKCVQQ